MLCAVYFVTLSLLTGCFFPRERERERHVCLTLLHPSWFIHEPMLCRWLAVWVQSQPRSCHTKQWQRSPHVYLSESVRLVRRVSHHLSLLLVWCLCAVTVLAWLVFRETCSLTADPSKARRGYLMSPCIPLLWFLIGTTK